MADGTPPRQMSLIPYPYHNGDVVLRRGNSVVVYDAPSHQLQVRDAAEGVELADCPYCHRPMRDDYSRDNPDERGRPNSSGLNPERPYVDPDYFGMLAASQRPSPEGSPRSATPMSHFLRPALRSGRSREVSGSQDPPIGAEFVTSEPAAATAQGISKSAFSPNYFKQNFTELGELGRGGNGVVLLVEHIMDRVSLGQFACKRVPVGDNHEWLEKVLVEVKLLQKMPHRNLVAYHWVWLEDYQPSKFGPSIPCLWILQEYCNGGDLHAYVLGPKMEDPTNEKLKQRMRRRSRGEAEPLAQDLRGPSKLTFDEIFSFFRDITSGLHHLHSKGYIHRDLKPSNCLLQRDGPRSRVLISDFGEVQQAGVKRGSTGATGTISYCAPEVLSRDTTDGTFGDFTTKSDIFSLGMIVYFMCFGRLPYTSADDNNEENEDLDELRAEIMKWPGFDDETRVRSDLPEKLYRYLKRLLSVNPNERPSTDEILASIKAGAGLGDLASSLVEENSSRVSKIDSPRRVSPQRRKQPLLHRPGLSTLSRHNSSGDNVRPGSPMRQKSGSHSQSLSRGHSRPTSPGDNSIAIRPRKLDRRPSTEHSPSQHSPRLMLPPPPERSMRNEFFWALYHPTTITMIRATMLLAKLSSLLLPCSPYTANAWVLYPLLALAVFDIAVPLYDLWRSSLLLGVHVAILGLAYQNNRMCRGKVNVWDEL